MVGVGPGLLRLQTQCTLFPTEVFLLTDNNSTDGDLRIRMQKLGARDFEIVALMMDETRGHAALDYAEERAENPIPYAIAMFDNPDWQPRAAQRRIATNLVVDKTCQHCGGDRFVVVTDGPGLYEETYAPCRECNAETNTARWSATGERLVTAPQ